MQRQANRAFFFRTLQALQPAARIDLARATGLSRATVSSIVDELVAESLVEEVGATASRGGRRAILLRLRGGETGTVRNLPGINPQPFNQPGGRPGGTNYFAKSRAFARQLFKPGNVG